MASSKRAAAQPGVESLFAQIDPSSVFTAGELRTLDGVRARLDQSEDGWWEAWAEVLALIPMRDPWRPAAGDEAFVKPRVEGASARLGVAYSTGKASRTLVARWN